MTRFQRMYVPTLPFLLLGSLSGCAVTSGMQQRSTVCSYDHAWDAVVETVKDRSTDTQDKDTGEILTQWLEIPMPGRTYGVFRRDLAESKDRSRLKLRVKRTDDMTNVFFIEERQRWAFRGGSRLFGWTPTDPSEEMMHDVQNRLDAKLKEHGCATT